MTVEQVLIELARATPSIFRMIAEALASGDTPEQAIAKARALTPLPIDTTVEDAALLARIRAGLPKP